MTTERGSRHPRSLEEPLCLLAVQLHGRTIAQQDGRQAILLPGDLTLFDGTRPYRVDFQGRHFDHLVLRFPRTALEERGIDTGAVTVRRIALDSALGRLVTPFLLNVVQAADTVDPETGERLAGMSLDLIATALASVSGVERPPASPGRSCCAASGSTSACICPTRSSRRRRSPRPTTSRCASCTGCSRARAPPSAGGCGRSG